MEAARPSETPVVTRRPIPEYNNFSIHRHENFQYHVSLVVIYSLQSARRPELKQRIRDVTEQYAASYGHLHFDGSAARDVILQRGSMVNC